MEMQNLRIYTATWNVGTSPPDQDLHDLLSLSHHQKSEKLLPDIYVLSFQEVKSQPQNIVMAALFDDPWTNSIREILTRRDYVKIKTIRLQGLLLNVFALRKHLLNIREMESNYTRTGLSGMWGNKGAVSVRFSIYGCSVCFVNAHLSAHDGQLKDRIDDYNAILKDQEFHVAEHTEIFYHDYVFWMGDLNFRLREEYDKTPDEIEKEIKAKKFEELLENDQLLHVMQSGDAFSELTENKPTFPPTFKYEVGTSEYDHKRRPAWTDRILYRVSSNNYENVTLSVKQKSYEAHDCYLLSDHKPVTAAFVIKIPEVSLLDSKSAFGDQVFSDYSEKAVHFEKIPYWMEGDSNTIIYKVTREIPPIQNDWIGVFKENFSSLDEYILYEYVSKGTSPVPTTKKPHEAKEGRKFSITFSEITTRTSGCLRLIYFSESEDNVQSVLGISDPFPIRKRD